MGITELTDNDRQIVSTFFKVAANILQNEIHDPAAVPLARDVAHQFNVASLVALRGTVKGLNTAIEKAAEIVDALRDKKAGDKVLFKIFTFQQPMFNIMPPDVKARLGSYGNGFF